MKAPKTPRKPKDSAPMKAASKPLGYAKVQNPPKGCGKK